MAEVVVAMMLLRAKVVEQVPVGKNVVHSNKRTSVRVAALLRVFELEQWSRGRWKWWFRLGCHLGEFAGKQPRSKQEGRSKQPRLLDVALSLGKYYW
jgi:hypothetical protein